MWPQNKIIIFYFIYILVVELTIAVELSLQDFLALLLLRQLLLLEVVKLVYCVLLLLLLQSFVTSVAPILA